VMAKRFRQRGSLVFRKRQRGGQDRIEVGHGKFLYLEASVAGR
jgi:hypothetical protein